jgi:hypothetical protein
MLPALLRVGRTEFRYILRPEITWASIFLDSVYSTLKVEAICLFEMSSFVFRSGGAEIQKAAVFKFRLIQKNLILYGKEQILLT